MNYPLTHRKRVSLRRHDGEVPAGLNAIELVLTLAEVCRGLSKLTFTVYSPTPGLQDRLAESPDPILRRIARRADMLRRCAKNELPYWESVVAASWATTRLDRIAREALRHDSLTEVNKRFELSISASLEGKIIERANSLPNNKVLALCSNCRFLDRSVGHIPMMDFRCPPSVKNLDRVTIALKQIGQKRGAILETGKSYHFYGFDVLDEKQWTQFLAKCLLLSPLVDTRYIAHRLQIGTCVLRLTSCVQKPKVPVVVRILN
jgi:hypothetical protein